MSVRAIERKNYRSVDMDLTTRCFFQQLQMLMSNLHRSLYQRDRPKKRRVRRFRSSPPVDPGPVYAPVIHRSQVGVWFGWESVHSD